MHDLHEIAVLETERRVLVAVAQDRSVVFYDYEAGVDLKRAEQARDGAISRQHPGCAVDRQRYRPARFRTLNHMLKYSA